MIIFHISLFYFFILFCSSVCYCFCNHVHDWNKMMYVVYIYILFETWTRLGERSQRKKKFSFFCQWWKRRSKKRKWNQIKSKKKYISTVNDYINNNNTQKQRSLLSIDNETFNKTCTHHASFLCHLILVQFFLLCFRKPNVQCYLMLSRYILVDDSSLFIRYLWFSDWNSF